MCADKYLPVVASVFTADGLEHGLEHGLADGERRDVP